MEIGRLQRGKITSSYFNNFVIAMTKCLTKVRSIYFDYRFRGSAHALEKTLKAGVCGRGSLKRVMALRNLL